MHGHLSNSQSFLYLACMWQLMMMAMMLPVVSKWIVVMTTIINQGAGRQARVRTGAGFATGYFTVWLAYSIAASILQLWLQRAGLLSHHQRLGSAAGGALLILAGIVQFTPIKRACLAHCRNPLGYFLTRWRNGPMSAIRLGLGHGSYCVGCCWALMATAFALGVMNIAWMAVLTAIASIEQWVPQGDRIGRAIGVAITGWGSVLMIQEVLRVL